MRLAVSSRKTNYKGDFWSLSEQLRDEKIKGRKKVQRMERKDGPETGENE